MAFKYTDTNTARLPVITCDHPDCGLDCTRAELNGEGVQPQWFSNDANTEHCCGLHDQSPHLPVLGTAREFSQRYADDLVREELARALRRAAYVPPTLIPFNTTQHPVFSAVRALLGYASRADCPEVGRVKDYMYIIAFGLPELLPEHHQGELEIGPPRIVKY